jgi:ribonuclease HI
MLVKGNAGIPSNERADALAAQAGENTAWLLTASPEAQKFREI